MSRLLENDQIRLRAPEPEDLDLLYIWENDTTLWEYGAYYTPFSRFDLKQYLIENKHDIFSDKQLRLMIVDKATKAVVGAVDIYDFEPRHRRAEVGILIDSNHRGRGFGLTALKLLEDYAFGFLNLNQLYAIIPESNKKSIDLFTKAGYIHSGNLNEWLSTGTTFESALLMQNINRRI